MRIPEETHPLPPFSPPPPPQLPLPSQHYFLDPFNLEAFRATSCHQFGGWLQWTFCAGRERGRMQLSPGGPWYNRVFYWDQWINCERSIWGHKEMYCFPTVGSQGLGWPNFIFEKSGKTILQKGVGVEGCGRVILLISLKVSNNYSENSESTFVLWLRPCLENSIQKQFAVSLAILPSPTRL